MNRPNEHLGDLANGIPRGSVAAVDKTMRDRGQRLRIGVFVGVAILAGSISFATTQSLMIAATMAFVAGVFTLCAATFISMINKESTMALRNDVDQPGKSSND